MSCLLPPLFLVPLEDWFCPQCEHGMLIESLKEKLKVVRRAERSNKNRRAADRISQKTFSIDTENIVEIERRSCRQRKDVSYSDASYDKKFKEVFKEINMTEKKTSAYSSESDTDLSAKGTEGKAKKKQSDKKKRHSDRMGKSRQLKKSKLSGQSKTKRRKLTSLEDESEESGSDYVDADDSGSSDNADEPVDKSEDQPVNEIAFTSSGRQIKNVCYKIT
ncbi:remodeling and spacing factor 1-like [Ruditapes philippinarum]|uniref:remodeling and spacing factor 1-like n=1 Tax=Ruditapes philippinarum TaxID=129788 RepID=UPI00295BAC28|nr:remodeling and spacing factor 1-like [Ruditapes philippinarum]